jgi:hypothetical protein
VNKPIEKPETIAPVGDDCGDGPCRECKGLFEHADDCALLYSASEGDALVVSQIGYAAWCGAPGR